MTASGKRGQAPFAGTALRVLRTKGACPLFPLFPRWRLLSDTTGKTVVARLTIADGFWPRLAGLQLRRPLAADAGLLLVPCNSVHTCFLRFPVDLVFLDGRGAVLAVRRKLRPWRAAWGPRNSHAVLEVLAGSADLQPGEKLRLEPAGGGEAEPPRSVAFLQK